MPEIKIGVVYAKKEVRNYTLWMLDDEGRVYWWSIDSRWALTDLLRSRFREDEVEQEAKKTGLPFGGFASQPEK